MGLELAGPALFLVGRESSRRGGLGKDNYGPELPIGGGVASAYP